MEKFSLLGIPDHIYNWIVDYFSPHEHCTIFNGALYTFLEINSSVFQGSSLGPASYAVNASDLRPCTVGNDIVKFADDFDLIIPATNLDSRNAELQHIEDWSIVNKLNRNKSQEIVFYRPYSHQRPLVPELLGIPRVTSIKILGVILMNNLSMEEHLSSVIASSAKALYALRILRSHGMKNEDLMTVYQATVISRLQYASPAWWGYTTVSQRERLENFLSWRASNQDSTRLCHRVLLQSATGQTADSLRAWCQMTCIYCTDCCLPWLTITTTCARVDIRSVFQTRKTVSSKETFLFEFFIVDDRVGFSVLSQPSSLTFI